MTITLIAITQLCGGSKKKYASRRNINNIMFDQNELAS
jgi:hypothetical protein